MAADSTTLRVFLDAPPDATRAAAWSLHDTTGRAIRSGRGTPTQWPDAARREAVIAAAHGRIAVLSLPPLPPGRAEGAARFALEEQLAGASDEQHIALAPQRADGRLRVAIVAGAWMSAFAEGSRRCGIEWDRAVLESDLAEAAPGLWRWCAASIAQSGFVQTDQGATMAVGPAQGGDPPAELALALSRASNASASVRVDADAASPAFLARARESTGMDFVAGTPWRWAAAAPATYARAIDLLAGRFVPEARATASHTARLFRPALWIAGIALAFHVAATLGQWAWLRWQVYAAERELTALARAAVPGYAEGGKAEASPPVALARRESELEHRAGRAARDDFVPLLAQAAPALASLPAGALRSLSYADRHLTLDLTKLEPNEPERLQGALARAGLIAIAAPTQSGARLRIGRD